MLFLGFSHREAMADYEKREGFSDIIKSARARVEYSYEKMLHRSEGQVTGPIFALKNMGWKDRSEVDNTHKFDALPIVIMEDYAGDQANKND
jgi:phosphopantetheine adenylyltransferase